MFYCFQGEGEILLFIHFIWNTPHRQFEYMCLQRIFQVELHVIYITNGDNVPYGSEFAMYGEKALSMVELVVFQEMYQKAKSRQPISICSEKL